MAKNFILFDFFSVHLCHPSTALRADELGMDIAVIALPALLALAADPLASLVDTGFIGQIGIGRHVRPAGSVWRFRLV